jgi:hypothetical protein
MDSVIGNNFYTVVQLHDASNPLAAMDTNRPLMKRANTTLKSDNSLLRCNFYPEQTRKMLPCQETPDSAFKISIGPRNS